MLGLQHRFTNNTTNRQNNNNYVVNKIYFHAGKCMIKPYKHTSDWPVLILITVLRHVIVYIKIHMLRLMVYCNNHIVKKYSARGYPQDFTITF